MVPVNDHARWIWLYFICTAAIVTLHNFYISGLKRKDTSSKVDVIFTLAYLKGDTKDFNNQKSLNVNVFVQA